MFAHPAASETPDAENGVYMFDTVFAEKEFAALMSE